MTQNPELYDDLPDESDLPDPEAYTSGPPDVDTQDDEVPA